MLISFHASNLQTWNFVFANSKFWVLKDFGARKKESFDTGQSRFNFPHPTRVKVKCPNPGKVQPVKFPTPRPQTIIKRPRFVEEVVAVPDICLANFFMEKKSMVHRNGSCRRHCRWNFLPAKVFSQNFSSFFLFFFFSLNLNLAVTNG